MLIGIYAVSHSSSLCWVLFTLEVVMLSVVAPLISTIMNFCLNMRIPTFTSTIYKANKQQLLKVVLQMPSLKVSLPCRKAFEFSWLNYINKHFFVKILEISLPDIVHFRDLFYWKPVNRRCLVVMKSSQNQTKISNPINLQSIFSCQS
jgi:hypothetical protein